MDKDKIRKIYAGLCLALRLDNNGAVIETLLEMVGAELSDADREYAATNCEEFSVNTR